MSTPVHRSGSGSPLVLLHGMGSSWRAWSPVIPLLEHQHDVVAPTLPGHNGGVPLPQDVAPAVPALADALERQLDELGIGTAHLAGNSLGGWLALELARRGRAQSVVALSPAGAWRSDRDLHRVARLMRLGRKLATARWCGRLAAYPATRRLALRGALERGERMTAAEAREFFADMQACAVFNGLLGSIRQDGQMPALQDLRCPVRIAWGVHDRMIPFARYGRPLLDLVPGSELVALRGVGHVPMHDDPELVSRTILEHTNGEPFTRR